MRHAAAAAFLSLLAACGSSRAALRIDSSVLVVDRPGGSVPGTPGLEVRVHADLDGEPRLFRTDTTTREVPHLGFDVSNVDAGAAERLGVEPWSAVRVDRVAGDSAASRAGVVAGDLIRSLDGTSITSHEQARDVIAGRARIGESLDVLLLRRGTGGDAPVWEERSLVITPGGRQVVESRTESTTLATSRVVLRRTGMQVGLVPPDLASDLWPSAEDAAGTAAGPVLLVCGVVAGSPAYRAGVRGGDRLMAVDGSPPASLDALAAAAAPGRDLALGVDGRLGPYETELEVDEDVLDRSGAYVPILLDVDSSATQRRVSVLDFIFQFGGNYRRDWLPSSTREAQKSTYLSLFPLGMFEFRTSPEARKYRLFWLIRFERTR